MNRADKIWSYVAVGLAIAAIAIMVFEIRLRAQQDSFPARFHYSTPGEVK